MFNPVEVCVWGGGGVCNISLYYSFYCIYDQINSAFKTFTETLQKRILSMHHLFIYFNLYDFFCIFVFFYYYLEEEKNTPKNIFFLTLLKEKSKYAFLIMSKSQFVVYWSPLTRSATGFEL